MSDEDEEAQPEINWPVLILFLLAVTVGGFFGIRAFFRNRAETNFKRCQTNLQTIAVSAKMYARDNHGYYPKTLDKLTQLKYLPEVPTCPTAGTNTYSDYTVSTRPQALTVSCNGGHHVDFYRSVGDPQRFPFVTLP